MYSKEEAFTKISELVERFAEQIESYKRTEYNETLTRKDFIDPFFEALGWDMNNKGGAWEAYREVIHEDKLKVGGVTTAPDYSFRLVGGQRLFFVEAKKPSIVIKDDVAPAYQVRLYGWNAKLAISVVTDFEEFAIYECSKKPSRTDKASKARVNYFTYKDYLKEFDFFWNTFSKQQVIKGGLIKFQQSDKKGTATVDKDFLEKLDIWRKELAANIYKNNPAINEDELNFAVQQTIDRIIFLRIAEDRGLEPYAQLKSCLQNEEQYKELYRQFRIADDKYNSGLFHFKKEKDNNKEPDNISGKLTIENKVIKSIISSLYPPNSDYLFNVLPVEILGSAYEQFLGKQIIVKGSRAIIEDKPEVRKAGGVYYTPQYIVEYIVENTVGKMCADKTPKDVSKLKIVDPACGSGSFLLGAYQYLLTWHMKYYVNNKQTGKQKDAVLTPDGSLTTAEKKRILLNNIYGVDIDRNAVEVTKLSLLLKCMEGETSASINTQMTFFHERVLPSLENNIKSGNSLIDVDFYDTQFDFGEEKKIKPFNWQQGFPDVFKQGGFDVVIGNPPYRTLQLGKQQESQEENILNYYQKNYDAAFEYKINLFALFMERSVSLIKANGYFSFIVPNTLYNTVSFKPIRKFMLERGSFHIIMDLRYKVFEDAELGGSGVFVFAKDKKRTNTKNFTILTKEQFLELNFTEISSDEFLKSDDYNLVINAANNKVFKKITKLKNVTELGSIIKIYQGIITGDNKKFLSDNPINSKWKPILKGRDINKYSTKFNNTFVYYSPKDLWSNTDEKMFKVPIKIISRQTSDRLIATLDTEQYFSLDSTHVIHLLADKINIKYLLGVFNSILLNFIYQGRVQEGGRVFAQVKTVNLKPLPIKIPETKTELTLHNSIVELVDTMLDLNKQKQTTTVSEKLEQLNQRIAYTDDKINKLVYELYELTEDEIKIVEGK